MAKKAIILAAGRGTRMASYSVQGPKCLLEVKGKPLLQRQLESLNASGVEEFIIVGGYMFEMLENFIASTPWNVKLINNPFYAEMNSIGSLWLARDHLHGDVFITNADTYFESPIYSQLMNNQHSYIFGVDKSKKNDADYSVTLFDDEVLDMGKDIEEYEVMAEYIGIAAIKKSGVSLFRELLDKSVRNGNYGLWWEDLFLELLAKGEKISYVDVTGSLWFEVDQIRDYRRCQRYFND
ncbi:MAG: phosphocholine cytidylyltransferase family protein [Gammaproteobacteria bacterium]|nr:phosphocholine cytidylyltransferase family protein [Gammaproteobacteria bacterium]